MDDLSYLGQVFTIQINATIVLLKQYDMRLAAISVYPGTLDQKRPCKTNILYSNDIQTQIRIKGDIQCNQSSLLPVGIVSSPTYLQVGSKPH
eukprot:1683326-Amphidinium_carterae.1